MHTSGDLSLSVQAGGIEQLGAFEVGGESSFDAGAGDIDLTNTGNSFAGAVSLAGDTVSINDVGALELGTLATGGLNVTSHGTLDLGSGIVAGNLQANSDGEAIIQSGALSVSGTSTLNAGGASITLTEGGNDFGGAVSLTGGVVSISDDNALTLGALSAGSLTAVSDGLLNLGAGVVTGALDANSQSGAIIQSGPLEVGGTASLTAGGNITLGSTNNFFEGAVSLDGAAVSILNNTMLFLGAVDVASLVANASTIVLQDDVTSSGSQTYGAAVVLGDDVNLDAGGNVSFLSTLDGAQQLSIEADGHVGIAGAVDVGALSIDAGSFVAGAGMHTSGDLSLTVDAGGIGQVGAFVVGGDADFDAGAGDITLIHADNDFQGLMSLAGDTVTINDTNALQLDALATGALSVASHGLLGLGSGTVAGTLTASSDGYSIGQDGPLSVAGTSALDAGGALIILDDSGNDFGGAVSLAGGAVAINDVNALTLGTLAVGSLNVGSHAALDLGTGTVAGNLVANSGGGAITQSGALSIGGSSAINAGAGDITLDDGGNDFVGAVSLTGGAVEINDAGALTLGALGVASLDASSHGALDLGAGSIAGDLVADSDGGPIGQSGPLAVGGSSTLDAGAGDITLLDMNNDFVGAVSLTGGSVVVADRNQLTLGQVDATHLLALAATIALEQDIATTGDQAYAGAVLLDGDLALAAGGGVDFASTVTGPHVLSVTADGHVGFADAVAVGALAVDAGSLGLASSLDVSGDLSLAVQAGGIAQSQAFVVGGQTSLDAGTGAIVLTHTNNDFGGAVSLTGGAVEISDLNALTLGTLDVALLDASSQDALDLGQGTVAGNLVANSGGGAITQSGALSIGGASAIDAGAGDIDLTDVGNDFGGAVSLGGGAVEIADAGALALGALDVASLDASSHGALDLGQGSVAGSLVADSDGGPIGQSGALEVGGSSAIDAGAGDIALAHVDNDFVGAVSLAGDAVAIADRNQLTLGQVDASSLLATAATIALEQDIATTGDQTYAGTVLLDGDLALDAGGDVDFASTVTGPHALSVAADGHVGFGDAVAVGGLAVGAGSLDLASSLDVSGDLSLAVQAGGIAQSQAFVVGGQASLDAGTGAIALTHANNDFGGAVSLAGGAVAINDVNALTLGTLAVGSLNVGSHAALDLGTGTVAGNLVANSGGGAITQSGALSIGGSSAINAGAGDITLDDGGNDFVGAVSLTGGAVEINDAGALTLGALGVASLDASSHGALDLGAGSIAGDLVADSDGGPIGQSGPLEVGGSSALDAGTGDIDLTDAGNDFGGAVSLAGGAAAINDAGALTLGTLDVASLDASSHGALDLGAGGIAGTLAADSHGGDIGQSGALIVGGASTVDAGTGDIDLADAGNDFGGAVSLIGGSVAISDVNSLTLDAFDLESLSATSHGDLSLGGGTIAGALVADSNGGDIDQSGALVVGGGSAIDAGTGAIALGHAGNDFGGAVSLAGGAAAINDINALTLDTLDVASLDASSHGALDLGTGSIGGDLVAESNGGAIGQSGALAVGGTSTIDAGTGAIALAHAGNDFGGAMSLTGGETAINDAGALVLGTLDVASLDASSHGDLSLGGGSIAGALAADSNGGAIGQSGALLVGGTSAIDAGTGAIALDHVGNDFGGAVSLAGGAATINDAGALALGTLDLASLSATSHGALGLGAGSIAGTLDADSNGGAIGQSGALSVGGASTLDAGTGAIALTDAGNDFEGAVSLTGGAASISDANALALGALDVDLLSASSHGALDLGTGSIVGTLVADSNGGSIGQSGALEVGGSSTLDAGSGAIVLTDAGNDFGGAVSLAGGAVSVDDANALALGALDVGSLTARSHGALDLGQGRIAGNLVADSDGGPVTQSGALTIGGTSTIDAVAGSITLADADNDFVGVVSLTGGAATIDDVGALTLGALDVASLDASSHGALDLGAGSIAGALAADSHGGAIGQSGALAVGGSSALDAGAGAITLTQAGNDFGGMVSLAGGAVAISDANALTLDAFHLGSLTATSHGDLSLGGGTIAGALVADSNGGDIDQSGALVVGGGSAIDAGTGAIALGHAGNDFGGAVSLAGGAAAINDINALTLDTLDVASLDASSHGALDLGTGSIGGDLVAESNGGAIGQSGALAVGGTSTIDAGTGAIALAHAGNDFGGAVSLTGGATAINDAGALVLGTLDVASLDASSHGALGLGQGAIAGNLAADSNGGAIVQSGVLSVAGTSTIDAGTGDITLANAGNGFGGAVSLRGDAVAISDRDTLILGAVDATSLHATAATIALQQDIATSGDQTFDGAVALGGSVALASGGDIAFGAGVGGAHALSLNADGHVGFGGAVALGALSVDAGSASLASTLDVAGNLSLVVRAGDIVQAGAFRIGGTTDIDAGTGAIALTHAGNDFGGAVGLTGAAVSISDRNDLTLSHLRSTGGGDVRVTAGGALVLPVEAIDAGSGDLHLAANGGALTTRAGLSGADVTLLGAGGIALGHDVDATGTLRLDSGAGISQSGGRIQATQLVGSAAGDARLTGPNRIDTLGQFSASGIALTNAGPLTVAGPVDARSGSLLLALTQGDLAIDGGISAADIRLDVAGGISQGDDGQLVAGSLSGRAGGAVVLGDADRFVDNRIERIGDFTAHGGFSMTNGRSLTLASLNGSDFTIDAGSADVYLAVDGDLRQDGTEWMYNGSGTWSATGGIGLPASPIYVMGLEAQTIAALGVPPAYFYAVRPDGSLLPILGEAVNVPTSVWAGRAQTSSSRQVAYVDVGADASNYRGYGLVEPGVRLPDDQQPECDPDFPTPECEAMQ